jgi:dihydrodipicolinate synthase/N-acetylneuraminate lyase
MATFNPGLVHLPVTPFKADQSIDYDKFAKLLEFHLRNGADAIGVPMPEGEDMSLKDAEQVRLLEFAIGQVKGRVPVIAHVSDAGTAIAVARAKAAEKAGAAAIVSHPPYFWHPKASMIVEHLVQIGSAVSVPFFAYNPVVETAGTSLTTEIVLQTLERLKNFAGVVDASMEWVFMVECIANGRKIRPDFQLAPGTDFMVSAGLIGASGVYSPLSSVAPKLVRKVYELCAKQQFVQARELQEDLGALHALLKSNGFAGLKGAIRAMGRDCGQPRPPAGPLSGAAFEKLAAALNAMSWLKEEPRDW